MCYPAILRTSANLHDPIIWPGVSLISILDFTHSSIVNIKSTIFLPSIAFLYCKIAKNGSPMRALPII